MQFEFSTEQLPSHMTNAQRFESWCELFHDLFGELEMRHNELPFSARIKAMALQDVVLADVRGAFEGATYGGAKAPTHVGDRFGMFINMGDEPIKHACRGREAIVAPGAAMMVLRAEEGEHFVKAPIMHGLMIDCPRKSVIALAPRAEDLLCCEIDASNELLQLLRDLARSLVARDRPSSAALQAHAGRTIVDLIGLMFGAEGEARDLACESGRNAARIERILREIGARCTEPGFAISSVATRLGLSERTIQDILQGTGVGFSERLLDARLNRAREELRNPANTRRKISDFAYSAGFNDLSYFNRCFRKRFGASPSELRLH